MKQSTFFFILSYRSCCDGSFGMTESVPRCPLCKAVGLQIAGTSDVMLSFVHIFFLVLPLALCRSTTEFAFQFASYPVLFALEVASLCCALILLNVSKILAECLQAIIGLC